MMNCCDPSEIVVTIYSSSLSSLSGYSKSLVLTSASSPYWTVLSIVISKSCKEVFENKTHAYNDILDLTKKWSPESNGFKDISDNENTNINQPKITWQNDFEKFLLASILLKSKLCVCNFCLSTLFIY